jgi:hypothetical protein
LQKPTGSPVTPVAILTYVYNNGVYKDGYSADTDPYPLLACRGDCDRDSDCDTGLICFKRDGFTPVPGCSGEGRENKDYCYDPSTPSPKTNVPTVDSSQQPSQSNAPSFSTVPSEVPTETNAPSISINPSEMPTIPAPATFFPGDLTVPCDGNNLIMSTGMGCRKIATDGSNLFADGYQATIEIHSRADGATVIPSTDSNNPGGWYYVSNSESGNAAENDFSGGGKLFS